MGQGHPGFSEEQTRERIRRGKVAWVLRFALAGRHLQALVNEMLLQRASHPQTWHQQRLLDNGMDKGRIAELGGMTTVGIDLMMTGRIKVLPGLDARKILLIEEWQGE